MERYYDETDGAGPVWSKKIICVDCKSVHTLRPIQYYRRFRIEIWLITACLWIKIITGKWLSCVSRQRQQYWWRGYEMQGSMQSNISPYCYKEVLSELEEKRIIVSTHSVKYYEIKPLRSKDHLLFAVTPPVDYG